MFTFLLPIISKHGDGFNVVELSNALPSKATPHISCKDLCSFEEVDFHFFCGQIREGEVEVEGGRGRGCGGGGKG